MRRIFLTSAVVGSLAFATGSFLYFTATPARSANPNPGSSPPPAVAKDGATEIPVSQVVLFSSGVGYFQRDGVVDGSTRVDLSFPVQDINDLLKSMVLQDLGGGHVTAVSYDSQAPIEKTLRSFAINLTSNPTFGQILNQARGEKIEVILQQTTTTQPASLTGIIMGVETQQQVVNKEAVRVEMLNMWCAEGMRSVKLADAQRVRFLNPTIDSEVKKALETLALSHDTQKKSVSLNFAGEGKRGVKVGYVVENPIWKTSYRLVLKDKEKPFLQGWAVVENTSDDDWNSVRMALVSGRPISFQMDLYQPLFVKRPIVEPELFASLRPPTYSAAMEPMAPPNGLMAPQAGGGAGAPAGKARSAMKKAGESKTESRMDRDGAWSPEDAKDVAQRIMENQIDPRKSVASAAVAGDLGDFFQYMIEQPVTLPRQKSAMLPIVNQEVESTKVSIYNQATHPKFPLLGLKFKNTTSLHLMQGPITVFDGASYAGDSRILDLQPKEERLLSYAIDLGTEVEPIVDHKPNRIIKVKINHGIVEATHKIQEAKTFNIKNRSEQDRTVIIEHPFRPEFKLIKPEKASERARDVYRFELPVAKGASAKHEVVEEREILQQVSLSNSDDQSIRVFLTNPISSDKVKEALTKALGYKEKLGTTRTELGHQQKLLQDITADQARLRANLREMPTTAAAYKRYLEKFDKQETEIEGLQDKIKKLQETENKQRQDYDKYLSELTIE